MKKNRLETQTIATFIRQLSLIIDSDLPVTTGLEVIRSKASNQTIISIIESVIKDLKEGYSISEGLTKFEDELTLFVVNMIKLGEKSGSMSQVLTQVADTLEKEIEVKSKVRSALAYPIILSVLMLSVIVLLIVKVLPTFEEILTSLGGEMPAFTGFMISISSFLGQNIFIILGVLLLIVIIYMYYRGTDKGRYQLDKLKFHMPIQKHIVSALMGAKFSRNLSILLKSGFSFSIALEMLKPIMNNRYMDELLDHAIDQLKEGETMADVMEDFNLFPGVMIHLFSVAQQTGHMDKMLEKIASEMEKEADARLDGVATVLEPFLMIVLSILVGIILVSVILPILNILNSIG